jgi:hypothetical protein
MRSFLLPLALGSLLFLPAGGCSSDEGGNGGNGGSGANGACWPKNAVCYVAGPSGSGSECMAKHDNTGSTKWQGRLTAIEVTKPSKLALDLVQRQIIDKGVNLDQKECNEKGDGTFSWLFEFDSETKKLRTGGSLPVGDPKAGGCFITMTDQPLLVEPMEVDVNLEADGLTFSASGLDVNVPIFETPTDIANPIVLPLRKVTFAGKFNDETHNCIGRYKGDELDPAESCSGRAWANGGTIDGHITISAADKVFVEELGTTLCVFLAGISDWKGEAPTFDCATSAKWKAGEQPDGDWCSATDAPADASCKDAWRLQGHFAAAGFKVNGDCP